MTNPSKSTRSRQGSPPGLDGTGPLIAHIVFRALLYISLRDLPSISFTLFTNYTFKGISGLKLHERDVTILPNQILNQIYPHTKQHPVMWKMISLGWIAFLSLRGLILVEKGSPERMRLSLSDYDSIIWHGELPLPGRKEWRVGYGWSGTGWFNGLFQPYSPLPWPSPAHQHHHVGEVLFVIVVPKPTDPTILT